jgi:hypothetical protein
MKKLATKFIKLKGANSKNLTPGRGIICRQDLRRWGDEQLLHGPPGG